MRSDEIERILVNKRIAMHSDKVSKVELHLHYHRFSHILKAVLSVLYLYSVFHTPNADLFFPAFLWRRGSHNCAAILGFSLAPLLPTALVLGSLKIAKCKQARHLLLQRSHSHSQDPMTFHMPLDTVTFCCCWFCCCWKAETELWVAMLDICWTASSHVNVNLDQFALGKKANEGISLLMSQQDNVVWKITKLFYSNLISFIHSSSAAYPRNGMWDGITS